MSRSNYDKPFYVDVGTSIVAIRCASNHDVVDSLDHNGSKHAISIVERTCERMNKEVELSLGNAAAMHEALEAIRDEAYERIIDGLATDADWLYKTAKAALSSPPKNCDRFATVDKAMDDFADDALIEEWSALEAGKDRDMLAKELFMFAKWLFEPATERKGESDGK